MRDTLTDWSSPRLEGVRQAYSDLFVFFKHEEGVRQRCGVQPMDKRSYAAMAGQGPARGPTVVSCQQRRKSLVIYAIAEEAGLLDYELNFGLLHQKMLIFFYP